MEWRESDPVKQVPREVKLALLLRAVEAAPADPAALAQLGNFHHRHFRYADAIAAYEAAARATGFDRWSQLAECYLRLGRHADALGACARAPGEPDALSYRRGTILYEMGDRDGALAQFRRSHALRIPARAALNPLLQLLSQEEDGGVLLDFIDSLTPRESRTTLTRAYRAIAYSRLGRTDEAHSLVDLERHVVRIPFEPPAEFGGIEAFNRSLAAEILADPPAAETAPGAAINYAAQVHGRPAMTALLTFQRAAITDYISRRAELGMEAALPDPPATGKLSVATNALTGKGSNGEHIHPAGYVSAVYHVAVPPGPADSDRGALLVGNVANTTKGYHACWGERRIRPVPGWLVLMPSHVFHDVIPPGTHEPRISVACDLRAVP